MMAMADCGTSMMLTGKNCFKENPAILRFLSDPGNFDGQHVVNRKIPWTRALKVIKCVLSSFGPGHKCNPCICWLLSKFGVPVEKCEEYLPPFQVP